MMNDERSACLQFIIHHSAFSVSAGGSLALARALRLKCRFFTPAARASVAERVPPRRALEQSAARPVSLGLNSSALLYAPVWRIFREARFPSAAPRRGCLRAR